MRKFLLSLSTVALFLLVSSQSETSAAPAAQALGKKPAVGQADTFIKKTGWRKRRWRRYWRSRALYGPPVYGYYYRPRVYGYYYRPPVARYYYPPPVYGYYYRPYPY